VHRINMQDKAGLWGCIAHIDAMAGTWQQTEPLFPIWGAAEGQLGADQVDPPADVDECGAASAAATSKQQQQPQPRQIADIFTTLSFGLPSMVRLESGGVMLAWWCDEDGVTVIRWARVDCGAH